jgi:hypothetical protein
MSAGFGGTSASCSTKASRSSVSIGFHRLSNPTVVIGFTTQAGATHRSGEMPGIDLHIIRQRQQLLVEAGVQLRGIVVGPTWKIGTADRADEQAYRPSTRTTGRHRA